MNCLAAIQAETSLWNEPQLAVGIATGAASLLLATFWLMRRKSRDGRGAAAICLVLSIALHGLLICFLPAIKTWSGGGVSDTDSGTNEGVSQITVAAFEPELLPALASSQAVEPDIAAMIAPLPLPSPRNEVDDEFELPEKSIGAVETKTIANAPDAIPASLSSSPSDGVDTSDDQTAIDDLLSQWLSEDSPKVNDSGNPIADAPSIPAANEHKTAPEIRSLSATTPNGQDASPSSIPGLEQNDFGQRAGDAKRLALLSTGGDDSTEAAVEAALRFLAADQRQDGAWDPITSGAGRETLTLGTDRRGAGKQAINGITGLALLSMLGAGNTHLQGAYADNVRRGLSYLIQSQQPDGSLAGPATIYEANYCHGMAALAMCEAAVMTGDGSAIRSAAAAVRFTTSAQHPTTGGWRYVKGDPGDLSQLGWQAMVLDGGRRASIPVSPQALAGTAKFLKAVRAGEKGGLACYRPGEAPTRTMTAEALATRLLLGETIPPDEIAEAESFLLRQPPGVGKDNYYGWYYTSLALHQLQDEAWRQWNESMKARLLERQLPSGSWPTDDEWGGYGGRVYTTATATLCLEVYYRHALRRESITSESNATMRR